MSKLSENLEKKFIITCEIAPPRGPDLKNFMEEIHEIKKFMSKIYGINVVDNPGSMLLMSSLAASILLMQNGIEPIFQLTCRDRNVLALESDLISASAFGIENVLALTGDHPRCMSSDHKFARPVFELDSVKLIKLIRQMNQGKDATGKDLNKPTNFFIGAALAPSAFSKEAEALKTKKKLDAGANFFQTQAVFYMPLVEEFLNIYEKVFKEDIRKMVLLGVVPFHSYEILEYLLMIPGVHIPDSVKQRMKNAQDEMEVGIEIALELIDEARDLGLGGAHVMPAGKMTVLKKFLEEF